MAMVVTKFESAPVGLVQTVPILWSDPHTVEPRQMTLYISMLERACAQRPGSADARICLGMALAMNCEFDRSLDALEEARRIEPQNFFAQLKFAELHSRRGALERADEETLKAAELAGDADELALARQQLAEIRRLRWEATPKHPQREMESLVVPAVIFVLLIAGILLAWK
jgi:tetratricopeptide (TPR) repeat protein